MTDPELRFPNRVAKLREKLAAEELDAIFISNGENRRYLSGFVSTAGYLLITQTEAVVLTDFRYTEQADTQAPGFHVERIGGPLDWLPRAVDSVGAKKIGFEADDMTVAFHERVMKALDDAGYEAELKPTSGITVGLRAVKDESELELLQKAITIGDEAFEEVANALEPGMTEGEAAWRFEQAVRSRGAESISFETIVAAGANAARPHHRSGDTLLRAGETIVFDCGARYEGYCSDLTRTVVLGDADDEIKRVYDIVLAAQLAGIEMIESGITGEEADGISRNVITEAGHGDEFGHSLGHGVGLEVHENPGVGPNSKGKLEDGMVLTVEPGIYISGWGGVRIEDVVVLENGKPRVLSHAPKMSF